MTFPQPDPGEPTPFRFMPSPSQNDPAGGGAKPGLVPLFESEEAPLLRFGAGRVLLGLLLLAAAGGLLGRAAWTRR